MSANLVAKLFLLVMKICVIVSGGSLYDLRISRLVPYSILTVVHPSLFEKQYG